METFIPAHPNAFLKIYTVGPLVTEKLRSFSYYLDGSFPRNAPRKLRGLPESDIILVPTPCQPAKFENNVKPVSPIDEIKEKICLPTSGWWNMA